MSGQALSPEKELVVENWKPAHDRVLLLYIAGYQIKDVAEVTGYCREHVGELLKDPRAQKRIDRMRERMYDQLEDDISMKLEMLGAEAVDNIRRTLVADHKPGTKAKKHQDKMSFDLLDRIGHGKSNGSSEGGGTGSVELSEEDAGRLVEALEKSKKAREEHEIEMEPGEEGSFSPSENGSDD